MQGRVIKEMYEKWYCHMEKFKSQIQIKVKLPITWLLIYIDVRY